MKSVRMFCWSVPLVMGACSIWMACSSGSNCVHQAATVCEDGVTYFVDSCGRREDVSKRCDCGCDEQGAGCATCVCEPACEGKACGPDGCGGLCPPGCEAGLICDGEGQCLACVPHCDGKDCGPDQCGGSCPPGCASGETCDPAGICHACEPACADRSCGQDGCGGRCPPGCGAFETCDPDGLCQPCEPACIDRVCGSDACGGVCPPGCPAGEACTSEGLCLPCTPDCQGRLCGPDGCGGDCGVCAPPQVCGDGACGAGDCTGQPVDVSGQLLTNLTDVPFDAAVVSLIHSQNEGGALPGCIASIHVELTRADGCRLTLRSGDRVGPDGGYGLAEVVLSADAACPGLPGASQGIYRDQGGLTLAQVVPGAWQVPHPGAAQDCLRTQLTISLAGALSRNSGGEALAVAPSTIVLVGDFSSSGDALAPCPCFSNCLDRACGPDGCGGSCGTCGGPHEVCAASQQCVDDCAGLECGPSPLAGFDCGSCTGAYQWCNQGFCHCQEVACGLSCCAPGSVCNQGVCCLPDCTSRECGDDGCGGDCGPCTDPNTCTDGLCLVAQEWVPIAGGSFMMGCDPSEGIGNEQPIHAVSVPAFEISKTEVTSGQFRACVADGGCSNENGWMGCTYSGHPGLPINCLTFDLADAVCAWLGGRLPTEAEWEFAARDGGLDQAYPWGAASPNCALAVMRDASGSGCGLAGPAPVCSRVAGNTASGLCDMAGNLCEIVEDSYHYDYLGAPDDGSAWINPDEPYGICRGGGFNHDDPIDLRTTRSHVFVPDWTERFFGTRCVRPPP